jgi:hypothetical protein
MTGDTISVSYVEVAIVERPIGELISNKTNNGNIKTNKETVVKKR